MKTGILCVFLLLVCSAFFCFAAESEAWLGYNGGNINEEDLCDIKVDTNIWGENISAWGLELTWDFFNTSEWEEISTSLDLESTPLPELTPTPSPACYSCEMNVSGIVTDTDGNPLEGATVYLLDVPVATTDEDGYYEFTTIAYEGPGCPPGDTYIYVNRQGEKFIGVICGDFTYNFSDISPYDPWQTPEPEPTNTPEPGSILGDVDNDNLVTIIDALFVAQYYVGIDLDNFNIDTADVNCDGLITIVDALIIAQYYIGLFTDFC